MQGQKWSHALVTGGVLRKAESQTLAQGPHRAVQACSGQESTSVCRASNRRWLRATWCQAGVGVGVGRGRATVSRPKPVSAVKQEAFKIGQGCLLFIHV